LKQAFGTGKAATKGLPRQKILALSQLYYAYALPGFQPENLAIA
jgi:hypothetical protein